MSLNEAYARLPPVCLRKVESANTYREGQRIVKVSMQGEESGHEVCEQCGLCCKIFGDSISPTAENLFFWIEEGRQDILQYFSALKPDGTWVSCADLRPDELDDLVTVEMRDPVSHEYLSACPFLHRVGRKKYLCRIHDVKPEMCCTYQPWIWGETYFNRCQALKNLNHGGRWPV